MTPPKTTISLNQNEIHQAVADKQKIYTLSLWPDGSHQIRWIVEPHDYRAAFVVIPKNLSASDFIATLNDGAWNNANFNGVAITELFEFR